MKPRTLILAVLLPLCATSLFGYDFGAVLGNASSYGNQQTPSFTQKDKLDLWFTTNLGQHVTFTADASAQLWNLSPWYILNLDLLNLSGEFPDVKGGPSVFSFTAGRYLESDFTGFIYSGQSIDGFKLGFGYPKAQVTIDLGYTGLTLNPLSYIYMTQADVAAQGNSSDFFGSPRIVGRAQVVMPSLFLQQDLTLTAIFQQDLRSLVPNANLIQPGQTTLVYGEGGSLDSEYFGAGLSGSIVENLFYKSYLYVETGQTLSYLSSSGSYQYEPIVAFLAGGGARYYLTGFLGSAIGLDLLFASGDSDWKQAIEGNTSGYSTAFVPITSPPRLLALAFSPNLENIVAVTASYSIRPFPNAKDSPWIQNLQAILKATPFLRPTTGAVGAPGIAPSMVSSSLSSSLQNLYLGSELDLIVNYRPFSDLGVALQGGLFVPNSTLFTSSSLLYYSELDVSLSF